jgi:hypothetical protein
LSIRFQSSSSTERPSSNDQGRPFGPSGMVTLGWNGAFESRARGEVWSIAAFRLSSAEMTPRGSAPAPFIAIPWVSGLLVEGLILRMSLGSWGGPIT